MSRPSVTICILTYNQQDYIGTCVRSVAEQVVDAELHILVGDDASTDRTSTIVSQLTGDFPGRIEHIRRDPNVGVFANLRDLVARANGDFIAIVDGDDYWLPGKLARQVAYLQTHPECVAVYSNAITMNEQGDRTGLFNDAGDVQLDLAGLLRHGNFLNNSSGLVRATGRQGWLAFPGPQIDYQVHLQHARQGLLGHIAEPLAVYRVNTQGSMVASTNDRVREWYWQAIQSVPRNLVSDRDYAAGLADFLRRVFFRAVHNGRIPLLRDWVPRVLEASPYGSTRTLLLAAGSIARIVVKELAGLRKRDASGKRVQVLYRC